MSASPELRRGPLEALPRPIAAIFDDERPGGQQQHRQEGEEEEEECRTPTAAGCKIPPLASCPPAPKKARMAAPACRRRLLEVELVVVAPEDVPRLFGPAAPPADGPLPAKKRKRREFER